MSQSGAACVEERVRRLEQATGKRVVLRGVKVPERAFRGRVSLQAGLIVLEYRDETAGYFWHYSILEELLGYAEAGQYDVVLYEKEAGKNHAKSSTRILRRITRL